MEKVRFSLQGAVFCLFVLLFSCAKCQNSNGSRVVDSLKFVAVVSRTGNRGPLQNFKNSPYPNLANYWPYGKGELTKVGRQKMFDLGVKLRSLYDGFVSSEFSDSDFSVKSTDDDISMLCAETLIAGLYPPVVDYQIIKKNLNWMPIPIYTSSSDKTQAVSDCAKYQQIHQQLKNNFTSTYNSTIETITSFVNKIIKDNITGLDGINVVFDSFFSMDNEGYVLPKWTKSIYPTTLNYLMNEFFLDMYSEDDESVTMLIGLLFKDVLESMDGIVNGGSSPGPGPGPGPSPTGQPGPGPTGQPGPGPTGQPGPPPSQNLPGSQPEPQPFGGSSQKLVYFSGFDVSLVALQKVLGIPRDSRVGVVSPASAMIFELHQDNSTQNYTVQALYIDGNAFDLNPAPLLILGCEDSCAYDYFVNATANFTSITNFDQECKVTELF